MPSQGPKEFVVFITSPLEAEHVRHIRSVAPDRVEVIHEPDLLPPIRYVADHKGKTGFARTPEQEARWLAHLGRATIVWDFPSGRPEDGGGLARAPNVRWVQTTSSGVGQLVHALKLAETDLLVTTARGIHAEPLSEFVFLALLAHVKNLARLQADQNAHRWERYCGDELARKRLAIIGAGRVGERVARIAQAFDMHVTALVNNPAPSRREELGADALFGPRDLHQALRDQDYVVLCAPHTPSTEGMFDKGAFAAMKPGVVLVNIGRGQLVDEVALIQALRTGQVAFAALDVTTIEPLPVGSPLWDHPNVLISPHSASTAASENGKITEIFRHNLAAYVEGRPDQMINLLDKKRMY